MSCSNQDEVLSKREEDKDEEADGTDRSLLALGPPGTGRCQLTKRDEAMRDRAKADK